MGSTPLKVKGGLIFNDFEKVMENSVFTFFYWFDVELLRGKMMICKNKLEWNVIICTNISTS